MERESNPLAYFQLKPNREEQARSFNQQCTAQFSSVIPSLEDQSYYTGLYNTTRFLLARDFDTQKGLQMWKNWCKWRVSYRPHEIKFNDIANELKTGKGFHFGEDSNHNAIVYCLISRNDPTVSDEEGLKFGIWLAETALVLSHQVYGGKKLTIILDKRNFTKKQMSGGGMGFMKDALRHMQDYYPETLSKFYMIGLDWFFRFLYGVARPFTSEKTRNKLQMIDNIDILKKEISKDNLIKEYGGNFEFKYDAVSAFNRLETLKAERGLLINKNNPTVFQSPNSNDEMTIKTHKSNKKEEEEEPKKVMNDSLELYLHVVSEEHSLVSVNWKKYQQSIQPCNFPKFNLRPQVKGQIQ